MFEICTAPNYQNKYFAIANNCQHYFCSAYASSIASYTMYLSYVATSKCFITNCVIVLLFIFSIFCLRRSNVSWLQIPYHARPCRNILKSWTSLQKLLHFLLTIYFFELGKFRARSNSPHPACFVWLGLAPTKIRNNAITW